MRGYPRWKCVTDDVLNQVPQEICQSKTGDAANARKTEEREAGYSTPPPPPPPPLLLKLPWRESTLSHTNGYSIAEILLVFGIIAGVLIGVWGMYTILAEENDVKAAVAEIRLIREAAVQFKHNDGGGKYNNLNMTLATFGSYLGDGVAQDKDFKYGVVLINTFGQDLFLGGGSTGENLILQTHIPNLNVCRKILEHFGEVQAIDYRPGGYYPKTHYYIPAGKSIFGYLGGPNEYTSGCSCNTYCSDTPRLIMLID